MRTAFPLRVTFTVEPGEDKRRLDVVVHDHLSTAGVEVSRATVQRWIEQGRVQVDDVQPRSSARARSGAHIDVRPDQPPATTAQPDPTIKIDVLFEDDHLVVINKPAGLVVHPARGHADGTLVNGLLAHVDFDLDDGEDTKMRPGIVHRLDKGTSGVMVVAKSDAAREGLKALFAKHDLQREYEAVVVGKACSATYDTNFGRHPTDRIKFSTRPRQAAKRAVTHVQVVELLAQERASRVVCRLETGRTHQIRVHLAECAATPVLGDPLYGQRPHDPELTTIGTSLGRPWLHARLLGFRHPITRCEHRFVSPTPVELQAVLDQLRNMKSA